jgi:hypothetical protein
MYFQRDKTLLCIDVFFLIHIIVIIYQSCHIKVSSGNVENLVSLKHIYISSIFLMFKFLTLHVYVTINSMECSIAS